MSFAQFVYIGVTQYEKRDNFDLVLEEISDTFIFLRYVHERKAIDSDWGAYLLFLQQL